MEEIIHQSIRELSVFIRQKKVSPVEVVKEYIQQIRKTEPLINAYITIVDEQALQQARKAENEIMQGVHKGKMHGIPYAVKDIYDTKGIKTTMGSPIFAEHIPEEDATVVQRLKEGGAVLLGKNNTHEFAMGSTNENPHYGDVRNPWNLRHVSGGSSGGSGAAVAASSTAFSLGTDTGGSIRIPASVCGVVGLKPTYGRVSKKGIFENSFTLDHGGPLAKSVWDAAAVLESIAGFDRLDETSANCEVPMYTEYLNAMDARNKPLSGYKVGICEPYYFEHLDRQIEQAVRKAIDVLAELGAEMVPVDIPHIRDSAEIKAILSNPQCAAFHEKLLAAHAPMYGEDIYRRLQNGLNIPAWVYVNAERSRDLLCKEFQDAFDKVDVLAGPTMGFSAFAIGEKTVVVNGRTLTREEAKPLQSKTPAANVTGCPAISVPCGFTDHGLPIGLQLTGAAFGERTILEVAYAYEQNTEFHKRKPSFHL